MMTQILNVNCWSNQAVNFSNIPVYIITQINNEYSVEYFRNLEKRIDLKTYNWLIYAKNEKIQGEAKIEK